MTETYNDATKQIEIYLRGRTLQVSSVIEMLLAQLLIISRGDEPDSKPYNFRHLTFHGKIKESSTALKEKFPEIWTQNEKIFDDLLRLKDIRNKIAHCRFQWLDKDGSVITIWDISEVDKIQFFTPEKYSFQQLVEVIEELKKLTLKLSEIVMGLKKDFDIKYPGVLNLPPEQEH